MKLIKLHMVYKKWDAKEGKDINDYKDLYVNIYHIGAFTEGNFIKNTTNLMLRNGWSCNVRETTEEILELIKEVK